MSDREELRLASSFLYQALPWQRHRSRTRLWLILMLSFRFFKPSCVSSISLRRHFLSCNIQSTQSMLFWQSQADTSSADYSRLYKRLFFRGHIPPPVYSEMH